MTLLCLVAAAVLGLLTLSAVDAGAAADDNPVVVLDTSLGTITVELDKAKAPITVENFLKYVDSSFYDGLTFHRVIPEFMVQGGGLDDRLQEKSAGIRPPIANEASNGLSNKRGTIAMARTSDPDSATAQFFINLVDNARGLDPRPGSAGYAVFGKVIDGMPTVDAIAKVQTGQRGPHGDVPVKPVYIKSVKRKPKA
jgi:peptidyl-prolyl cis-trans isomerase A (cyclophilin A)